VPKGGGVYRVGQPYMVGGRVYVPEENVNYSAEGMASWYGDDFHGRYTANGEVFDLNSISAAHPTLPLPSYVRVTNVSNSRSIVVRVNDRGPYARDRLIDVSVKTAELLGFHRHGVTRVRVDYVGRAPLQGSDDHKLIATLREGGSAAPVQLSANKLFAPANFSGRSVAKFTVGEIPSPPDRPYRLGEDARESGSDASMSTEFAAAARPRAATAVMPDRSAVHSNTSAVSAFTPSRYDGGTGYTSGRGLY
jgi:rare lipoprotein A